jgi:hypothetical protein
MGLNIPPSPEEALNIPRFFSLSSFSEYLSNIAYSPTINDAIVTPIRVDPIKTTERNIFGSLHRVARAIAQKEIP